MQQKYLVLSALVFGAPLALHTPVVSAQQQGTAGTYSGSSEAAITPRDAEGGRPIPRAERSPSDSDTVGQSGESGMSGSSAQGEATTPRDAEGGRPIPRAERSPSDPAGQARESGLGNKSSEAGKGPRDAEAGFPFGGSQSTVQGYYGARQTSSDETRQIQQALKDKGHDPGEIDGIMGSKTRAALRDFQKANGLQASGTLDGETATALGVTSSGASQSSRR